MRKSRTKYSVMHDFDIQDSAIRWRKPFHTTSFPDIAATAGSVGIIMFTWAFLPGEPF